MKRLSLLGLIILSVLSLSAWADSPLTSTTFYEAYEDIPMVQTALESKRVTPDMGAFLMDKTNPMDVKAAVVNALSWDGDDKAPGFISHLAKKYQVSPRNFNTKRLDTDEKALLAYMKSLDHYDKPQANLKLFKEALNEAPHSFTIGMLYNLTKSQNAFTSDWCESWKVANDVITNHNYSEDKMRESGVKIIMDYMNGYQEYCYNNSP